MKTRLSALFFLMLCVTASPGMAQGNAGVGRQWAFVLSAGELNVTRRDETTSPLRFGGDGFLGSATVERTSQRYRFEATLLGASAMLHTNATLSSEEFSSGELGLAALRSLSSRDHLRWNAGLAVNTTYEDTFHRFDVTNVSSTTYRLALVTAGPMLAVEICRRFITLDARLSAPLLALVDHPYSDVKNGHAPIDVKVRTLSTLRAVNSVVSLTTNNPQFVHARATFRASAFSYADDQPVHAARSSFTVGITVGHGSIKK